VYVVTYDVSDPKRLRLVYKTMKGYGAHLQLSVFRCELSDRERIQLIAKLAKIIKHDEDQVLFFPLGPPGGLRDGAVEWIGRTYRPTARGPLVV
jgi:CRISPR-associated protein Cas2